MANYGKNRCIRCFFAIDYHFRLDGKCPRARLKVLPSSIFSMTTVFSSLLLNVLRMNRAALESFAVSIDIVIPQEHNLEFSVKLIDFTHF